MGLLYRDATRGPRYVCGTLVPELQVFSTQVGEPGHPRRSGKNIHIMMYLQNFVLIYRLASKIVSVSSVVITIVLSFV